MTAIWQRSSARLLIAELAQFLATFVLLIVALLFWVDRGSGLAAILLGVALFAYAPLRVGWVLLRWSVETYTFDQGALTVRSGIVRRQERHLSWASVAAVDEQAGLLFRALSIRRLQLTQTDSAAGAVVFRALDIRAASAIRSHVQISSTADFSSALAPHSGTIYRASWRELALMSIVNGRFAVLAPPVLLSVWGFLSDAGVTTWAFSLLGGLPRELLIVLSVLVFILIGTVATISRYQGFSARFSTDGALILTYGLVEKRERKISVKSIEGVSIRRSFVEQLLRRSRLEVLTFKGSDSIGASVVLPSLPDRVVREIARSHFGDFVRRSPILSDSVAPILRQAFRALLVYAGPGAMTILLLNAGVSIGFAGAIGLIVLGASTIVGRIITRRIFVTDHGIAIIQRRLITEVDYHVKARTCHSVWTLRPKRSDRALLFSVNMYAGGARNFVGAHCSPETVRRLRDAIRLVDEPAAQRQRSLTTQSETES